MAPEVQPAPQALGRRPHNCQLGCDEVAVFSLLVATICMQLYSQSTALVQLDNYSGYIVTGTATLNGCPSFPGNLQ